MYNIFDFPIVEHVSNEWTHGAFVSSSPKNLPKTNMIMETPPFEDLFSIKSSHF